VPCADWLHTPCEAIIDCPTVNGLGVEPVLHEDNSSQSSKTFACSSSTLSIMRETI
jgi:hypothetical protein